MKTTVTYWNPLRPAHQGQWTPIVGLERQVEELTLGLDPHTGEYTHLTYFLLGADNCVFGGKVHTYPDEVFMVNRRLYDQTFALWLGADHYASCPPSEQHGPFKTDVGCVALEASFPQHIAADEGADGAAAGEARVC